VPMPPSATHIETRANSAVIEYVPGDLTITVGTGISLSELNALTAEHGQWCPILPWGTDECTLGGALATAARGPASAALGAPRDLTLGITFVDGLGSVVTAGGRVVKNVAGFDITRVLVGSWGTLGVITSASLRLRAIPAAQEAWAIPAGAIEAGVFDAFARGPFAPVAAERVPESIAPSLGLSAEPYVVVWLAASAAHVQASRNALHQLGDAREIAMSGWSVIRASGPFAHTRSGGALSGALLLLNDRVRRAFDPDSVFASAAMVEGKRELTGAA